MDLRRGHWVKKINSDKWCFVNYMAVWAKLHSKCKFKLKMFVFSLQQYLFYKCMVKENPVYESNIFISVLSPTIINRCNKYTIYDNSYTFVARWAPRASIPRKSGSIRPFRPWVAHGTLVSRKTIWSWRARGAFALKWWMNTIKSWYYTF